MATYMSEINDSFLSKISDYSYLSDTMTQQDIEDDLFGYFKTARAKFYRCKSDLTVIQDSTTEENMFNVDLHPLEIEILATLMLVEYLKPKIVTDEVIKQTLSDADFRIYSQAGQLRELRLLYIQLKSDASKMITEYTYLDFESFDQNPKSRVRYQDVDDNVDSTTYTGNKAGGNGY